jgi:1-deoxy-D-xylulose-5-phosphate synthase
MLEFAFQLNSPVSIRYPKGEAYSLRNRNPIELGKSQVIKTGKDVCLMALGSMVKVGFQCIPLLKKEGVDASLVNARFIKPLDEDCLEKIAREFHLVITLEEGNLTGGFGSAVLEFYERQGLLDKIKLIRAGFPDEFISSAQRDKLLNIYGLDGVSLNEKIMNTIKEEVIWQKTKCSIGI